MPDGKLPLRLVMEYSGQWHSLPSSSRDWNIAGNGLIIVPVHIIGQRNIHFFDEIDGGIRIRIPVGIASGQLQFTRKRDALSTERIAH